MKHLLKLMDLSEKEIIEILNTADQLKYEKKNGIKHHILAGKTLGMIFETSSTISFAGRSHSIPIISPSPVTLLTPLAPSSSWKIY